MEAAKPEKRTSTRTPSSQSQKTTAVIRVWDGFVRVFHWSLVVAFAAAYLSADEWRPLHIWAGYAAATLIVARTLWGFVGTRYARFAQFVKPPGTIAGYLLDVLTGREGRYLGHNPAGGAMIVALLVLLSATSLTGWLLTTDAFWGSTVMDTVHEWLSNVVLLLVVVHIAGVFVTSVRHRENLVWAMIAGLKRAPGDLDVS